MTRGYTALPAPALPAAGIHRPENRSGDVEAPTAAHQLAPQVRDGPLVLSFAQQELWIFDRLRPQLSVFNIPYSRRLLGRLDVGVLEDSLRDLVERHESLRTHFAMRGWQTEQVIQTNVSPALVRLQAASEEDLLRQAAAEASRPFTLENGPLFRATLIRMAPEDHVVVLSAHHAASDGWSMNVMMRDLTALYESRLAGKPSSLKPLGVQYADFAIWQREFFLSGGLEPQLAYWREQLRDAPRILELPVDHPRAAIASYRGRKRAAILPAELLERAKEMGRREGVTLYMTLLAAFGIMLWRYSGQEDVLVGSPISGRNRVETEEVIGMFVNTLVFRIHLAGNPTVRDLLRSVRETTMDAHAHQDLPFLRLLQELEPERDLSRHPIYQVRLALENVSDTPKRLGEASVFPYDVHTATSEVDLTVIATESAEGLEVTFEYSADLFDATTIERMMGHYEKLFREVVEHPEMRIAELPLLLETERRQVLSAWNETARNYPGPFCIHELFEEQAERTPEAIACVFEHHRLTYGELNALSNQVAHYLIARGAGPEIPIGICMSRGLTMLTGLLGILKAGSAYVPLDPNYPKERLAAIVKNSRAPLVLTQMSLADRLPGFAGRTISLDAHGQELAATPNGNPQTGVQPHNLAYVLFTSGSTGEPKGVALEHRSAATFAQWGKETFTPEELAGVLCSTSLSFDLSVFEIFVTLHAGGKIIIAENALHLASLPAREEITLINTVPSAMAELVRTGGIPHSVITVNLAGEALPDALVEEIYANTKVQRVYNLYGPTEDTTYSTFTLVRRGQRVTIGRPIANTQSYILDAASNPVPVGVPGQLFLAGDGLAREYFGRPDLTAERFLRNPFSAVPGARMYLTGDLCRWLPDGNMEYLGRMDYQVKLRGFRIEPGEVEAVLSRHPGVRECVVIAREDVGRDKRLVAYFVRAENGKADALELSGWVKGQLPHYMVPSGFVELPKLPLTPNGKINRKALPQEPASLSTWKSYVAPRNEAERTIAEIWAKALNREHVSIEDNFFEIGGHSLLAVQVFAQMEHATGKKLPLDILFGSATIREIASLIEMADKLPAQTSIRPCRTGGAKTPIYAAHGIGGTVLTFRSLAAQLDPDQPVYCLEAFGLDGSWTCLEDLAALYIKDLLEFQPEGPYHLVGFSFGGMVIFEMARQLHAAGHRVGLVGLLDSWNMGAANLWSHQKRIGTRLQFLGQRTLLHYRRLHTRGLRDWPRYSAGRMIAVGRRLRASAWSLLFRFYRSRHDELPGPLRNIKRVYEAAGRAYVPKRYAGGVTLFMARDQDPADGKFASDTLLGWAGWAEQGIDVIEVEGDHDTMMNKHAEALAAKITKCLSGLQR